MLYAFSLLPPFNLTTFPLLSSELLKTACFYNFPTLAVMNLYHGRRAFVKFINEVFTGFPCLWSLDYLQLSILYLLDNAYNS